jgi:hypothetical protein
VGFNEDLDGLDLAEDVKARLRQAHDSEVDPLRSRAENAEALDRKARVTTEITELSDMGWDKAPAALAYARRVFLSPDADEVGAVLLSDAELELSGDEATGARVKEDVSAAHVLRTFLGLLPKTQEGKLAMALSDQGIAVDDHGRPANSGDDAGETAEEKTTKHKESLGRALGTTIGRPSRDKRYGGRTATGGGD